MDRQKPSGRDLFGVPSSRGAVYNQMTGGNNAHSAHRMFDGKSVPISKPISAPPPSSKTARITGTIRPNTVSSLPKPVSVFPSAPEITPVLTSPSLHAAGTAPMRSMIAPPKKTAAAILWFLVLGAVVFTIQHLVRPSQDVGSVGESEASFVTPLGGITPPPVVEEPMFEVSKKGESAPVTKPRIPHQSIEDNRDAMCGFYKALRVLDKSGSVHKDAKSVRILHFGDSILTTDQLTGRVREQLQKRFGDGGHGFILLGKPWRWYRHQHVMHGARGKWSVKPLTSAFLRGGIFGLGGVAFDTRHPRARTWVGTADEGENGRRVASFDISYLMQPAGGSFDVKLSGETIETISTQNSKRVFAHKVIPVEPGAASLTLVTRGNGPVRLFGAVLESDIPGIVYDTVAINGVRAANFLKINENHFTEELQRRKANLVIMMCGANEGNNESLALNVYKENLKLVLDRFKQAVPDAACLVMGPLDQAKRREDGKLVSKRMPRKLAKLQRNIALEKGCAYFDTYTAMGGMESMPKWYRRGLAGGDYIHPTEKGSKMIGSWLTEALLAGYENFVFNGEKCELSVTSL